MPKANFIPTVSAHLSYSWGRVAPGGSIKVTLTIKRGAQSVTLSNGSVPVAVTITFATNPITDRLSGVKDVITISTTAAVVPRTY